MAKKKRKSKARKTKKRVSRKPKRRVLKAKKRRAKKVVRKKRRTRKNPTRKTVKVKAVVGSKTVNGKTSKIYKKHKVGSFTYATAGEMAKMRAVVADLKAKKGFLTDHAKVVKGKKKTAVRKHAKAIGVLAGKAQSIVKDLKMDKKTKLEKLHQLVAASKENLKQAGVEGKVSVSTKYIKPGGKKVAKKRKSKKKATKKVTKKKSTRRRRKRGRKAVTARVYAGKKSTSAKIKVNKRLKKGERVSAKVKAGRRKYRETLTRTNPRRNPMIGEAQLSKIKALGPIAGELGGLAVGGAVYGASNKLMSQYAAPVYNMMQSIPVVGTVLPNILLGIGLTLGGQKVGNQMLKSLLTTLGQGLIGAGAVGIGVNASQYIPGVSEMSGVAFTAGSRPRLPGAPGPDFSGVNYTPKMSGVDYTPQGMQGVDFTPGMGSQADFGGDPDFGLIPDGLGLIPEGLG